MGSEENIQVAVRVRPLADGKGSGSLAYDGENVLVSNNQTQATAACFPCKTYLSGTVSQEEVFQATRCGDMVESALDGFPVTIFAYGNTGAGKSHTIFGQEDKFNGKKKSVQSTDGLLPRIVTRMMETIETRKQERTYKIRVTSVEVYNEQVKDVFDTKRETVAVRYCRQNGYYLENATVVECESTVELVRVVKLAAAQRTKCSHLLNARSNRSHCIITIYIDSIPVDTSNGQLRRYGKLTVVDLAGSERASESGVAGQQLREAGHINRSLHSLNQVIQAMNSRDRSRHIPVRDSKLTMLLADGLGGNSKTLMIACVHSAAEFAHEAARTLQFAMGVAKIKNKPTAVLNPHEKLVAALKAQIRELQEENRILRMRSVTPGYFTDNPVEGESEYRPHRIERGEANQLAERRSEHPGDSLSNPYGPRRVLTSDTNVRDSLRMLKKKKIARQLQHRPSNNLNAYDSKHPILRPLQRQPLAPVKRHHQSTRNVTTNQMTISRTVQGPVQAHSSTDFAPAVSSITSQQPHIQGHHPSRSVETWAEPRNCETQPEEDPLRKLLASLVSDPSENNTTYHPPAPVPSTKLESENNEDKEDDLARQLFLQLCSL